jgi:fumarylacetoacetase
VDWTGVDPATGFGLDHLPLGSATLPGREDPTLVVRIGDRVLDAGAAARAGLLPVACDAVDLRGLLAATSATWTRTRTALVELFRDEALQPTVERLLHPLAEARLQLPFPVGDYVDFYAGRHHAENVGRLFRPDREPLPANWLHLPVGYHGRSSTVVVDGTPVARPRGLRRGDRGPTFGPTRKLDLELELGWVVGGRTAVGEPVPIDAVEDHVFGVLLLDDWSARDVQSFEYVPLGPFLGKSFATSVGAWVTPLEALQDAKVPGPVQRDPEPAAYLRTVDHWGLAIDLEVLLRTRAMRDRGDAPVTIATSSTTHLYWTIAQQLAHLTVNGAAIRPGDLCGTGTISGPGEGQEGSLLERTLDGQRPLRLPDGEVRTYLEDGDEVTLRGVTPDGRVRLADVTGRVLPAVGG